MISARLVGGTGGNSPEITERGQLVTGPLSFSQFYLGTTVANNTAVNVVPPVTGKCFVITAIILSGNRDVGVNGAITDVFENLSGPTDGTINTEIIQEEIAKQTRMTATGLNIIVSRGAWVNVKSDDVIVRCNIAGYYVDDIG
jgi:hypothetical protein